MLFFLVLHMGPLTCLAMAGRRRASPCTCTHTFIYRDHSLCSSFGLYSKTVTGGTLIHAVRSILFRNALGDVFIAAMCTVCLLPPEKLRAQGVRTVRTLDKLSSVYPAGGRKSPVKSRPFNAFSKKKWLFGGSSPRSFISQPLFISSNHWVFLVVARLAHVFFSGGLKARWPSNNGGGGPSRTASIAHYHATIRAAQNIVPSWQRTLYVHQCTCYVPSIMLRSIRSKSWSSQMSGARTVYAV